MHIVSVSFCLDRFKPALVVGLLFSEFLKIKKVPEPKASQTVTGKLGPCPQGPRTASTLETAALDKSQSQRYL